MSINIMPNRLPDGKIVQEIKVPPFRDKVLHDGCKLFRRKHGQRKECLSGQDTNFDFIVPYSNAKIDQIEIIGGSEEDCVDLKVYDDPSGTISSTPDLMLNQFGFDVYLCKDFYRDKSDYDADVFQDMKIQIVYKNNSLSSKDISVNIVFHQVVAP